MADPHYNLKENPEYDREIPALTTATPAHAEAAFRPVFESLLNNTEYVRQLAEAIAADVEALTPGDIGADPVGSAAAVQQSLNSHTADKNNPHGVTPAAIGADPSGSAATVQTNLNTHTSAANPHSGSVPTSRTVNGKPLSANISLTATDVSARASNWMPTAADVGAVPTTRTVNNKALSANISLTAGDVSALPIAGGTLTGQVVAQDSATISKRVRNIQLSTTDMTAGVTPLTNGVVYMVYET